MCKEGWLDQSLCISFALFPFYIFKVCWTLLLHLSEVASPREIEKILFWENSVSTQTSAYNQREQYRLSLFYLAARVSISIYFMPSDHEISNFIGGLKPISEWAAPWGIAWIHDEVDGELQWLALDRALQRGKDFGKRWWGKAEGDKTEIHRKASCFGSDAYELF